MNYKDDNEYWKIFGSVISPITTKPSRLGGPSAYKVILMLLEKSPNSIIHKERIEFMSQNNNLWGRKMKKLLEIHFE